MHKPTVEIPIQKTGRRIQSYSKSFLRAGAPEIKSLCLETITSKMGFWNRLKYLFTGKAPKRTGPITPPVVMPKDIGILKEEVQSSYSEDEYNAFAGQDIRFGLVYGLGENPTREELLWVADPLYRGTREEVGPGSCMPLNEVQAISVLVTVSKPQSVGDLICVHFEESLISKLEKLEDPLHLIAFAANESGVRCSFALPNFKITSWSWASSVDDLISEEKMVYEADVPMYWEKIPSPAFLSGTVEFDGRKHSL